MCMDAGKNDEPSILVKRVPPSMSPVTGDKDVVAAEYAPLISGETAIVDTAIRRGVSSWAN
jgi:hypothetical protein